MSAAPSNSPFQLKKTASLCSVKQVTVDKVGFYHRSHFLFHCLWCVLLKFNELIELKDKTNQLFQLADQLKETLFSFSAVF